MANVTLTRWANRLHRERPCGHSDDPPLTAREAFMLTVVPLVVLLAIAALVGWAAWAGAQ